MFKTVAEAPSLDCLKAIASERPFVTARSWPGLRVRARARQRSYDEDRLAGQRQLSAGLGNRRSRPGAVVGDRQHHGNSPVQRTDLLSVPPPVAAKVTFGDGAGGGDTPVQRTTNPQVMDCTHAFQASPPLNSIPSLLTSGAIVSIGVLP